MVKIILTDELLDFLGDRYLELKEKGYLKTLSFEDFLDSYIN